MEEGAELITGRKVRSKKQKSKTEIKNGGTTDMVEQNFANHVRWVTGFHFFVMPVMALNFGWSIYRLKVANFSLHAFVGVLFAAPLVAHALYALLFPLAVHNRSIR